MGLSPLLMRPSASVIARHPQWFSSQEKNEDYAYGLLLLSVHAYRALYYLTVKILRQGRKCLHREGVHAIACSVEGDNPSPALLCFRKNAYIAVFWRFFLVFFGCGGVLFLFWFLKIRQSSSFAF